MPINKFTAFYPSRPFWAGNEVSFADQSRKDWFHDQMVEEVFSQETDTYTIKVCRDGRIMLRVEALERNIDDNPKIEEIVKKWGEYLDYLNAFYLLLDSSTVEIQRMGYFNLHEITNRDAFRVRYEAGRYVGENIAIESIASVFQNGRYPSYYPLNLPIEHDHRISMRQVISVATIEHAASAFSKVVTSLGSEKTLASFAKSLSEYKIGNYETSIVLSWFIVEAAISHLWKTHLDDLNNDQADGSKKINRDRRDLLTGRDFTMSIVSNLLELLDILPNAQFQDIDKVRGIRNKIVHGLNFVPGPNDAQLAIKTAQAMIDRLWGIHFTPSLGYSVTGL